MAETSEVIEVGSVRREGLERGRAKYLEAERRAAVGIAYRVWRDRRPWRWLPNSLRARIFGLYGDPRIARLAWFCLDRLGMGFPLSPVFPPNVIADWRAAFRAEHWVDLEGLLLPAEQSVDLPWMEGMSAEMRREAVEKVSRSRPPRRRRLSGLIPAGHSAPRRVRAIR